MRSSRFLDALPEGGEGIVSSTFAVNNPPFGLLLLRLMKAKYSLHVCCDPLRQVSVNHPGRTYHGHAPPVISCKLPGYGRYLNAPTYLVGSEPTEGGPYPRTLTLCGRGTTLAELDFYTIGKVGFHPSPATITTHLCRIRLSSSPHYRSSYV